MKEKMYSKQSHSYLHDHIIDGFSSSHAGIKNLKQEGIIQEREYLQLMEKNIERLITRVKEFRISEKILCVFFVALFTWLQVSNEDLEMRRASRFRLSRRKNAISMRGLSERH